MPYPNEHACRLNPPDKYERFARKNCEIKHDGKCIDVIYGIDTEGNAEAQAYRYDKAIWTESAARSHCQAHDGTFEPASDEKSAIGIIERRTYDVQRLGTELREDIGRRVICGHAAIFDSIAGPPGWKEMILRGAFAETIANDDIRALYNHDENLILGRTKAGTLRLREDEIGLWMEIDVPDTSLGKDLIVSIERGDITQASFGFIDLTPAEERFTRIDNDDVRLIKRVKLYDVSPVVYPFYEMTDVSVKKRHRQRWLRCKRRLLAKTLV